MAQFTCINSKCSNYGKAVSLGTSVLVWDKNMGRFLSKERCISCDSRMELLVKKVDLEKINAINKGATKISDSSKNTIY